MADNFVTRILITAKDKASSVFGSLQAKAAGVAVAIASYFSASFLGGAITSAADFEQAMSRVGAATGATGEELQQLKRAAEEAAAGSAFTQVQTAQALENLAKAGLNAQESIAALPGVMALAAAGDIELAQSAEIVTRTVAGMGIAVEDTARIADVLAKGANASNTSVKGLAEALSYTAPTARSVGLSLEQTVAILGKFADGGIDASRAGTALNAVLSQFLDPASKFRGELSAIGITTGDFDKALRQLAKSGETGSKAILAVGTEAGPALRSLLNQGVPALDALKAQLDGAAGSAAQTAEKLRGDLNGAFSLLSGAWDSLKTKLGEPVLPVLTQGVKDLAAGLRGAVADGTATKFGEAIRAAFAGAIEWVRKFAAEADPAALAAKLQEAAGKVGAFFDDFGAKATNAGNLIQSAWGVMSAGSNILLSGVYKLGEIFSTITFGILQDLASISSGMARVTFGSISEGFKVAAAELSVQAGAAASVAEAYGVKAREAFEGAVAGAENARAGWAGLTKPASDAKVAVEAVAEAARVTAGQLDTAGEGAAVASGKIQALGASGAAAAPGVKAVGDAAKGMAADTATAADTAARLAAAYQQMGLQSASALGEAAKSMKGHYEAIKADGTATPAILEAAFRKYAESAIAANGGVASETLKAEAAMRGLSIQSDGAAVSITKIGEAGHNAGRKVRASMDDAAAAISKVRSDAEKLSDRLASLKNTNLGAGGFGNQSTGNGSFEDLRKAGMTPEQMRNAGYSSREIEDYIVGNDRMPPGMVNRLTTTSSVNTYQAAIDAGLSDAEAKKVGDIYGYYVAKGNREAQQRAGGTMGLGFNSADYAAVTRDMLNQAFAEAKRLVSAEADSKSGGKSGSPQFWGAPNRAVTVHLNIGGRTTSINAASQDDADALVRALQTAAAAQS